MNNWAVASTQTIRILFLVTISLIIISCGGGGGGTAAPPSSTASDTIPDAYSFTLQNDAAPNTVITSSAVIVNGINSETPISITGGEYSIDGSTFTSVAGTLNNGQSITIRLTSGTGFQVSTTATLTIGGVSADFVVTTAADAQVPTATITFPPAVSLTDAETVTIIGTASDNNTVTTLRVNTVDATSTDAFANWNVSVPLPTVGPNTLTVAVSDIALNDNNNAASVTINAGGPALVRPSDLALDSANNRLLIIEFPFPAAENYMVSVDLSSGARRIFSDFSTPNNVNPFGNIVSLVVDAANNRALVSDFENNAIFAVDLTTGARTIFSNDTTPDAVNTFGGPFSLALDSANNALYAAEAFSVVSVDLTTGARSILSSNTFPNDDNPFTRIDDLVVDVANNRLLVLDRGTNSGKTRVVSINLAAGNVGARTIISQNDIQTGYSFTASRNLTLDSINNQVLVSNNSSVGGNSITAVNLGTGVRSLFSDNTTPNTNTPFVRPTDMILDALNSRILMLSDGTVIAVDLAAGVNQGARNIIVDTSTPNRNNPLSRPFDITMDSANARALVIDPSLDAVIAVDPNTGARTILSDNSTPNGTNPFSGPLGIVVHGGQALVTDETLDAVIAVDLTSGARTILSDDSRPDNVNSFTVPNGIAVDSANGRVLVVDNGQVFSADLTTGARTIFSDNSTPDNVNPFTSPGTIAVDAINNRALIADTGIPAIVAASLIDGSRTILSDNTNSGPTFISLTGITVDNANNRALVVDSTTGIIAFDLTSGDKTLVSDATTPNTANTFGTTYRGITIDTVSGRILVVDESKDAVFAIEPNTGERVILSQ